MTTPSNKLFMSRKGKRFPCEVLRSAHLSTGKNVYLIHRDVDSPFTGKYVVGVRCCDETLEFLAFDKLNKAICYYLDMLACYA